MAGALQAVGQSKAVHDIVQVEANEHAQNGVEPPQIAGGTQGFDPRGC